MGNLLRMDTYRIFRSKTFFVCLILAFALAVASAPVDKLLSSLGQMFATEVTETAKTSDEFSDEDVLALETTKDAIRFRTEEKLSNLIKKPFTFLATLLLLISVCSFYYADAEGGYIKNIAGQMPMKGFTILSKFLASVSHNFIFMALCVVGNIIGTLTVRHFVPDDAILSSIGIFFLKLLLIQSICALLVLFVSTMQNKSLGNVMAVLFGLGFVMPLIYELIDVQLINRLFKDAGAVFAKYMPDVLLGETSPDPLTAILVSVIFGGFFLLLAIRIFDRKDVK